ncbi:hypothetical protein AK89_03070 [Enterococcus mundtii CRL35]|nr:hypothetical protein AK89_03070 [Enterococcus mundtii CRL35]
MAYFLHVKKPYIKQTQPTHLKVLMVVLIVAKTVIAVDFQGIARLFLIVSFFYRELSFYMNRSYLKICKLHKRSTKRGVKKYFRVKKTKKTRPKSCLNVGI